ncbi:MAG: hypothetical protein NTV68_14780, partial [Methanomicrobiales archaeon]|nr:hypothetical protein [Methanomicrobiales archaeon]
RCKDSKVLIFCDKRPGKSFDSASGWPELNWCPGLELVTSGRKSPLFHKEGQVNVALYVFFGGLNGTYSTKKGVICYIF